jgi:hypothetical protein
MRYISTANQKTLEQTYRTSVIIALTFCFMPLLLMGLGRFLGAQHAAITDPESYYLLNKVVYGGALLAGLLVVMLRRFWLVVLMRGSRGRRPIPALLSHLRLLALLSAALGELVAVLGFVAFSLTGDYQFCWRLCVVGLLLILYSFPRRWEWERAVVIHAQDEPA